jgi:hypothetical protein
MDGAGVLPGGVRDHGENWARTFVSCGWSTQISRAASLLVPAPRIRPPRRPITATCTIALRCSSLLPSTRHGLLEPRHKKRRFEPMTSTVTTPSRPLAAGCRRAARSGPVVLSLKGPRRRTTSCAALASPEKQSTDTKLPRRQRQREEEEHRTRWRPRWRASTSSAPPSWTRRKRRPRRRRGGGRAEW